MSRLPEGITTISCVDGKLVKTFKPASECSPGELMAVGLAKFRHKGRKGYGPFTHELENYVQRKKLEK